MSRGWVTLTWQPKQAWLISPKNMPIFLQQLWHEPRVLRSDGDPCTVRQAESLSLFSCWLWPCKHQQRRKLIRSALVQVFWIFCCLWGWERNSHLLASAPSWIFISPSLPYSELDTWGCSSMVCATSWAQCWAMIVFPLSRTSDSTESYYQLCTKSSNLFLSPLLKLETMLQPIVLGVPWWRKSP